MAVISTQCLLRSSPGRLYRIRTLTPEVSTLGQCDGVSSVDQILGDSVVGGSTGSVKVDDAISVSPITNGLAMPCPHLDVGVEQLQESGIVCKLCQIGWPTFYCHADLFL